MYFISGLGADERVFQKLKLPVEWKIQHLAWLKPLHREPLKSYTKRMYNLIDTREAFAVVGLSFGGMVATELANLFHPGQTIILSSISTLRELPASFRFIGKLGINKVVPSFLLNRIYPYTYWYFGIKTKEEKQLLRQVVKDTSPQFLKWAIEEILHWKNEQRPPGLIHIHGTKDHIFPIGKTNADIKVTGGGHLMVYSKAEEISSILKNAIEKKSQL